MWLLKFFNFIPTVVQVWETLRAIEIMFSWQSMNFLRIFEVFNASWPNRVCRLPKNQQNLTPSYLLRSPNSVMVFSNTLGGNWTYKEALSFLINFNTNWMSMRVTTSSLEPPHGVCYILHEETIMRFMISWRWIG